MNHEAPPAYGLWSLVVINSAVFLIFAFSFTRPKSARDWRSFGAFAAFIVALFTEMYGFPLTIYLLAGWLGQRIPQVNLLAHDTGHLWHTIFQMKGNPHFDVFHIASNLLIFGGFILLANAWRVLYRAQTTRALAAAGPYAAVRHPQYDGFVLIMFGFLLQWPTIPTLVMFPVLVWFYSRLARREEAEMIAAFGDDYRKYAEKTPAFIPWFGRPSQPREPRALHGASGAHVGDVSG
jgi:protein-S-isoprenylcysteine O-methyltransferase Ste14